MSLEIGRFMSLEIVRFLTLPFQLFLHRGSPDPRA